MKKTRLAVIGTGAMGMNHCRSVKAIAGSELAAVCDANAESSARAAKEFSVQGFTSAEEMMDSIKPDGIIITTPHYSHHTIAAQAFTRGIHVLTEKPIAAQIKDGIYAVNAWKKARETYPSLQFAAMFQLRTHGVWKKIKEMITRGDLGRLMRCTWIITTWYRSQAYYNMGGWRGTWKGEGGGVLLNQCPHNLDLYCWLVGSPGRIMGFTSCGKYHKIEVEDEVTAYLEHANGMVGHFITSTAESPGTNRLEITGENGVLVYENNSLTFKRNEQSVLSHIQHNNDPFSVIPHWLCSVPFAKDQDNPHKAVIENFADAINSGAVLIAPAEEGLAQLSLGNGIMLSSHLQKPVSLPLDPEQYSAMLQQKNDTPK